MKKIVFAGDWTVKETVGVHRFAHQILLALDRLPEAEGMELLVPEDSAFVPSFRRIRVVRRGRTGGKLNKYIWQQWTFPRYVKGQRALGVDLALALPVWGCDVCAIHDCILEAFPEGYTDHRMFRLLYLLRARCCALRKKREILTVTHDAAGEIQKYYGVARERITVLGNGWEHMAHITADETVFDRLEGVERETYFFALGSQYRHKNFGWVLKTAEKNPQHRFVVSGTGNFSREGEALLREKPENVTFTGYLTDGELKALMAHCRAFIQPSLYEGFGIPPLEALSLGRKIIVSRASCLPEVYGDAAYYIDPHSDGCDLDALLQGEVGGPEGILKKHTWQANAEKLLALLKKL